MDTLTQAALGAAVGEAVLGPRLGRRAQLLGAVIATLPDLDVLVPFDDAVASFTYHRSASHSVVVLSIIAIVIFCAGRLWVPAVKQHPLRWLLFLLLVLNTHVLLDCFTVYGTQALWPLSEHPFGWGSIFIIDPLYTVPLLIGLWICRRRYREQLSDPETPSSEAPGRKLHRWITRPNTIALTLSTLYLALTLLVQQHVTATAIASLQHQQDWHAETPLMALPTPGLLLWRLVVREEDEYQEGFHSLLDASPELDFTRHPSGDHLLEPLQQHWPVQRLQWFTKGFYAARIDDSTPVPRIVIDDLRMGIEAAYVFSFAVAEMRDSVAVAMQSELLAFRPDWERLRAVFARLSDENVVITTEPGED